jgi:hypothetical protein
MTNYTAPPEPSSGENFDLKSHLGALLRIEVLGTKLVEGTKFGDANAVVVNLVVLDGEHKADEYNDCLLFPKVIYNQLKDQAGKVILGRLGQGENKKGNPPWLLAPATEGDLAVARKYDEYKATQTAAQEQPF